MFILYLFPWERILKDGYKHFWKFLHSTVRCTISIIFTVRFKKIDAANASLFVIVRQSDHGQIANVSEQKRS